MRTKRPVLALIGIVALLAVAVVGVGSALATGGGAKNNATDAAGGEAATTPLAASHGGPVSDYVSLLDQLRANGASVTPAGPSASPVPSVSGVALTLDGEQVQVYEYADEAVARADSAGPWPDGSGNGTTLGTWIGPPHFYRSGTLVVLYIGDQAGVLSALEVVLGPQVAGR